MLQYLVSRYRITIFCNTPSRMHLHEDLTDFVLYEPAALVEQRLTTFVLPVGFLRLRLVLRKRHHHPPPSRTYLVTI